MGKKALLSIGTVILLVISLISNIAIFGPLVMYSRADPGDISESWDNTTTLNVTVLQLEPRINWFDFQFNNSGVWGSVLDQQIDVDSSNEYRFVVNVSSDQGWEDIDYIFVEAWADLGDDTGNNYNSSAGGNKNLNLTYMNTSGGPSNWTLHWPDDEATIVSGDCFEWDNETDPDGSPGRTACRNITFAFVPGYQFRTAPGDGSWDTTAGINDLWSWNFNITAVDQGGYQSYNNPSTGESTGEFGVFTYTEIVSVGWPSIVGNPGTTAIVTDTGGSGNITVQTRSNGNYSLDVDLDQLTNGPYSMANTTVSIRGGDVSSPLSFPGPIYLYGGVGTYRWAQNDTTSFSTTDIEYRIAIPLAQMPGDYTGTLHYHLLTQTS